VLPVNVAVLANTKTPLPFSVRLPLPETPPENDSGPPTIVASTAPFNASSAAIVVSPACGPTKIRLLTPRLLPAIEKSLDKNDSEPKVVPAGRSFSVCVTAAPRNTRSSSIPGTKPPAQFAASDQRLSLPPPSQMQIASKALSSRGSKKKRRVLRRLPPPCQLPCLPPRL